MKNILTPTSNTIEVIDKFWNDFQVNLDQASETNYESFVCLVGKIVSSQYVPVVRKPL